MILRSFIFLLFSTNSLFSIEGGFPDSYYKIRDSKIKKSAFINTMLPKIHTAQKQILSDRAFVQGFFKKYLFTYSLKARYDVKRLIKLSKKYRINHMYNETEYLIKIDTIPISLVLAQSAVESAWGDSRFSKEGNNLFGEWTWGNVGLIPEGRDENATHRLRIFKSLDASISRYMLNLNRHRSYKDFRVLRAQKRALKQNYTGLEAATKMTNYSQMRQTYNRLLVNVINGNDFTKYEQKAQKMKIRRGFIPQFKW
ncbi:glucosaminidase domain-containing protein [Sulfurimonas sp. MAG313]|nr:glucosaminidase domain-containing protein [Sulfurimonas sp. MAG313]MDF1880807.1 glucosaminidase domain-containing protein [Sulfurimonas sp. MAG313]